MLVYDLYLIPFVLNPKEEKLIFQWQLLKLKYDKDKQVKNSV